MKRDVSSEIRRNVEVVAFGVILLDREKFSKLTIVLYGICKGLEFE